MRIGIIGSRRRDSSEDEKIVFKLVENLIQQYGHKLNLVSGGCPYGADAFAEKAADYYGVSITVHYPVKIPKPKTRHESIERFFFRNRKIAENSDILYCLISPDRTGGTENTIGYAREENKKIMLVMPDGQIVESTND